MSAVLVSLVRMPHRAMRLVSCDGPRHGSNAVEYLTLCSTGLQVVRRRVCMTRADARRFLKQVRHGHPVPILPEHVYVARRFPDLSSSIDGRAA